MEKYARSIYRINRELSSGTEEEQAEPIDNPAVDEKEVYDYYKPSDELNNAIHVINVEDKKTQITEEDIKAFQSVNSERSNGDQEEGESGALVRIPCHYLMSVGRSSYVEYEVEIEIPNTGYVRKVFRRFSQFRDLHRRLCSTKAYGKTVSKLAFPNRKIFFSLSDSVSKSRQRDLQSYLMTMMATLNISTREGLDNLDAFFRAS